MQALTRLRSIFTLRSQSCSPLADAPRLNDKLGTKPNLFGLIEQRSRFHISGWLYDPGKRGIRLGYEVRHRKTKTLLGKDVADHFRHGLASAGIGDGGNAFYLRYDTPLADEDVDQVDVHPVATGLTLENAPWLTKTYEPISALSMDIVDNCNLRCPFCLYDYTNVNRTHVMSDETLNAALRLISFVPDGSFWFSCLHEPSLHPSLMDFIERVPAEARKKVFFTTNLSKRLPPPYFDRLAGARLNHINISVESLRPELFERFRKGARFNIFKRNWDNLLAACENVEDPTPLRYIVMAYKSNLTELPELTRYLLQERRASKVEIRYTFNFEHIDQGFRSS